MKIPVDRWFGAIRTRHSRRRYTGEPVPDEILDRLDDISSSFHPIPGARSIIVAEPPSDLFKGVIGSYGAITDSPHCIVLIGDMIQQQVQEAVGFHGEGLVLEATANGVDTCWVGGFFREESISSEIDLGEYEKILGVIAVGFASTGKSRTEKVMSGIIGSRRRKEIQKLLYLGSEQPTGWTRHALEAARLAPSAVNRQPWRFRIVGDSIEIFFKNAFASKSISPRLDCGIAMLHLEIGALKAGVKGTWEFPEGEPIARYMLQKQTD